MQDKTSTKTSWDQDLSSNLNVYRNGLFIIILMLSVAVIACLIWMQVTLSHNKIEPFIIEIDKKSGMATSVKPVTVSEYSANTAVLRSLIINYIRAREEYNFPLYNRNFSTNVRVFSDPRVYRDYANIFGIRNPNSPYNMLGKNGSIVVRWKSIIFPQPNSAQVRISLEISDQLGNQRTIDKIILMSFNFLPSTETPEEDRMINPLGFIVTMYNITDENPNV